MKKLLLAAACALSLSAWAKDATTTIHVSDWECPACPSKTEAELKKLPGVKTVTTDKKKGTAVVAYDDSKAKVADLEKAVEDSGFTVAKK